MSVAEHTPGPWHCKLDGTDFALIGANNELIGIIFRRLGEVGEIGNLRHGVSVNGNIAAAAPDLLEALQDMVSDHAMLSEATIENARRAIDKAEGRV